MAAADPTIPGARRHTYRHESVPGPRLLRAGGIPVTFGAEQKPGYLELRDDARPTSWEDDDDDDEQTRYVTITVDGILRNLRVPREALEAFMAATGSDDRGA